MNRTRLVVQTTQASKAALDQLLSDSQLTFTDWFDAKVCEEAGKYETTGTRSSLPTDELQSLDQLRSMKEVVFRLRRVDWAFKEDDTGYLSHSLHPYPAKFVPQLPATLIPALTLPGELVWDPFGGSGTTALEAALNRRRCISSDANPLAAVIGEAKTTTLSKEDEGAIAALRDRIMLLSTQLDPRAAVERAERESLDQHIPPIPNIAQWFHENAICELAIIRTLCSMLTGSVRTVALTAFSKTILKASYQDEETRYTRRVRSVPVGSVLRAYAAELSAMAAKVRQLGSRLKFRKPVFITADARTDIVGTVPPAFVAPESVALIVTSPPYPNANDYHLYHRFRLFWLGYDPRDLARIEIGSHLRHQKERNGLDTYLDEMRLGLGNCYRALQVGRYAVFVIGDCVYEGKVYKTAGHLARLADSVGFEVGGIIERSVHSTKRSFIPAARRLRAESLLVLQKPPRRLKVTLNPPLYRMWGYEDRLRIRETQALLSRTAERRATGELSLSIDPYEVNRLRQLTFTHQIETEGCGNFLTWQAVLENGDAKVVRARKDPKYVTHGLHPYKGKFYPQLAKAIFNIAGIQQGGSVLDPYCGSGTVLLEAQLNGLVARGCDINPLAVEIANAKCGVLTEDPVVVDRLLACFLEELRLRSHAYAAGDLSQFPSHAHDEIKRWFPNKVIGKLAWCLREIDRIPVIPVKNLLRICLSSIIRDVSQQDPRDLRIRRRVSAILDAPVFELLEKRVREQRDRLHQFASKSDLCPYRLLPARAFLCDSRNSDMFTAALSDIRGVDAVVTSPPYATALPYIDTNRLSLLILEGLTAKQRAPLEEQMIGSREISLRTRRSLESELQDGTNWREIPSRLARRIVHDLYKGNNNGHVGFRRLNMAALIFRYFRDMACSLRNVDQVLNRRANMFFVIGDNKTTTARGEITIRTTEVLVELGGSLGWKVHDRMPITVTKEDLRHSRHSITDNTVLWFKKV